jgi:hypothetical protein
MKDGLPLINECFGKCHTIEKDDLLVTGFLDALTSFSEHTFGSPIQQVKLENYTILIRKNSSNRVITAFILDSDEELESAKKKMEKAIKLFDERFGHEADSFHGHDTRQFESFRDLLLEKKIAQRNCGEREDCEDCPNCKNSETFLEKLRKFKKSLSMPR